MKALDRNLFMTFRKEEFMMALLLHLEAIPVTGKKEKGKLQLHLRICCSHSSSTSVYHIQAGFFVQQEHNKLIDACKKKKLSGSGRLS